MTMLAFSGNMSTCTSTSRHACPIWFTMLTVVVLSHYLWNQVTFDLKSSIRFSWCNLGCSHWVTTLCRRCAKCPSWGSLKQGRTDPMNASARNPDSKHGIVHWAFSRCIINFLFSKILVIQLKERVREGTIYLNSRWCDFVWELNVPPRPAGFLYQLRCKLRRFNPDWAMIKSWEANDFASFPQKIIFNCRK